jgi:uncharacterized membrane protein required for colicin V production
MTFDIASLCLILASSLIGMWKGGIKSLYSLFFFCFTVLLVFFLFPFLQNFGAHYIKSILLLNLASGTVAYVAALIFILIIERLIPYPDVSLLDRILGFTVGGIRGFLLSSIGFLVALVVTTESYLNAKNALQIAKAVIAAPYPQWATESLCANLCFSFVTNIFEILGQEWTCSMLSKIVF